jgi:two-component system chemotaxis sensor kinase CheA
MDRIGGSVDLRWHTGEFTRFVLDSPPSPATLRAIVAEVGNQLFALPIGQVERLVRIDRARVREVEGRPSLMLGDAPVPIATLAAVMGPPLRERGELAGAPALVLRAGNDALAVVVDAFIDEREVVVRPLDRRAHVPHVSGGALLPSGRIALVLVARSLLEAGLGREVALPRFVTEEEAAPAQHLLVVDDSITTRTLEQSVLEAAGYRVTVAVDGQDGWEKLQRADVDLVVSDVEMPRMTGFDLCRRIRESRNYAELPVVLVTGLETAEDRSLGLEVGADAYLLKSSFDQSNLLDTIRQLIG